MMTITIAFPKYVPFMLNFKAYSREHRFISSFYAHFYTFCDEIASRCNQVDLGILLNPGIMNNIIYDQSSL